MASLSVARGFDAVSDAVSVGTARSAVPEVRLDIYAGESVSGCPPASSTPAPPTPPTPSPGGPLAVGPAGVLANARQLHQEFKRVSLQPSHLAAGTGVQLLRACVNPGVAAVNAVLAGVAAGLPHGIRLFGRYLASPARIDTVAGHVAAGGQMFACYANPLGMFTGLACFYVGGKVAEALPESVRVYVPRDVVRSLCFHAGTHLGQVAAAFVRANP